MESIVYVNGILLLITISTVLIILIIMGSHYRKTKQRIFILIPLSFIGLFEPWLPHAITFLLLLSTGQTLTLQQHFFIALIYIPIALLLWIIAITEFILKNYRKIVIIIYIVTGILFEIFFLYFLFSDLSVIGGKGVGLFDIIYYQFVRIYLFFVIISISLTIILFILQAFKFEDRELKLKGIFLLFSLILYVVCSIADLAFSLTIPLLITIRACLLIAAITFYFGWFLPEPIKKFFKIS
ncbi:MAG: hypothetical protein ACFFAH_05855 [Promethearchaeota archaeon]